MDGGLSIAVIVLRAGQAIAQGWNFLVSRFPGYGRFWGRLARRIKHDQHLDWDEFERRCRQEPEFVGSALGLMAGVAGSRDRMRAHLQFVQTKEGPFDDRETVIDRVLRIAEEVANGAVNDEERVLLTRLLLEETIEKAAEDIKEVAREGTSGVKSDIADLRDVSESRFDQLEESLEEIKASQAERSRSETRAQIEAILFQHRHLAPQTSRGEKAAARIKEIAEELLSNLETEPGEPTGEVDRIRIYKQVREAGATEVRESLDRLLPEEEPAPASPAPVDLVSYAGRSESPEEFIDRLSEEDAPAADALRAVVERDGVEGIVELIRTQAGPQNVASLVTQARIVAKAGHFDHAEVAYLKAADLADDDHTKARQLVRAASMAEVQEAKDRAEEHMNAARAIAPEHPGLRIAEARASGDPDFIFEHLAAVEPETDVERALLHIARVQAHLIRRDQDGAYRELALAKEASPSNLAVREFEAVVPWHFAQLSLSQSEQPDLDALHDAGDRFLELANEVGRENRRNEEAHLLARAAESYALSEDLSRAVAVLNGIEDVSELSEEVRLALANAMIVARQPKRVAAFVSEEDSSEEAQLILADAVMFGAGDADARARATSTLVALLDSEDEDRSARAAFALLAGASDNLDVEWNDRAADIVRARKPVAEATLRAERLRTEGDLDGAEEVLLPFASERLALRSLRDYAVERGSWETVRDRSRELVRRTGDPRDRLMFARSLSELGSPDDARAEFLAIGRDGALADEIRGGGFLGAIEIAGERYDYGAVQSIAEEWRQALPDDANATWNLLFALARLSRHAEAYELALEQNVDADNPRRAALLAEILHRAAPPLEALTRIAELSDQYDRAEEPLEGIFFLAAMDAEQQGVEIPHDLVERIRDTIANFPQRFPESQTIRSVQVPESEEGIRELFEELTGGGDRILQQKEALEQIKNGQMPVNSFAAVGPGEIADAWLRLWCWPLGYAMDRQDEADLEAARASLGSAAVWDTSSIFVSNELGEDRHSTLRGVLPGSLIANETLEDADAGATGIAGPGSGETLHDPETGELAGYREKSDQEREREREVALTTLESAREFTVEPGVIESSDTQLRTLYEKAGPRAWKALIATIALAERSGLPIYSDDRWIREFARSRGIPAFGSLAALAVLAERQVISADELAADRRKFAARRAWGLTMNGDELVAAGQASEWRLDEVLLGALNDRAVWRANPGPQLRACLALLQAVLDNAPGRFGIWLHRTLNALQLAAPEMSSSWSAQSLLLIGWGLGEDEPVLSTACCKRLIIELERLPPYLKEVGQDPVVSAAKVILDSFAADEPQARAAALVYLMHRSPTLVSVRLFDTFVRS